MLSTLVAIQSVVLLKWSCFFTGEPVLGWIHERDMVRDNINDGEFNEEERNDWCVWKTRLIEGYKTEIGYPGISDDDLQDLQHRDFV